MAEWRILEVRTTAPPSLAFYPQWSPVPGLWQALSRRMHGQDVPQSWSQLHEAQAAIKKHRGEIEQAGYTVTVLPL